jgi:dihydroorotate dehydrogenase (NAD+) catalytic subunit
MFKQDLFFSKPLMNAAGTLGFAPDYRAPVPWEELGAFVTNPLSLRSRKPAADPAVIAYPGGFLLHTGLPNPGLPAAIKKFARRWGDSRLPVIVHLMADRPEETRRMVRSLEGHDNIAAVELGFAPLLVEDMLLLSIEMALGELPLIASLPVEQVLALGERVIQVGAAAISLAPPRGMLMREDGRPITGRLGGPALFPGSILTVRDAARANLPVIGAGGVDSREKAEMMITAGALAVQVDTSLWQSGFDLNPRALADTRE